jgi:glutamine amidotransferase
MGAENNPDGHGFAIVGEGRLLVGRGMDAGRVIDRFIETRKNHPNTPAMFHSRIGTAGHVDKTNCHPFYVGHDPRTVIAHNGILPHKAQPSKKDHRSDTRILAEVLLPKNKVGTLRTRKGRKHLASWVGKQNKLVVLTVDPFYSKQAFLINQSQGDWVGGVWYSNDSYEEAWWSSTMVSREYNAWDWDPIKHTYTRRADTPVRVGGWLPAPGNAAEDVRKRYKLESDECAICFSEHSVNFLGLCNFCSCCNDCGDHKDDCQCYTPKGKALSLPPAKEHWWNDGGDDTLAITSGGYGK